MTIIKTKLFIISLCLLATGLISIAIQNNYYNYIDKNGLLVDSIFLPIGSISLVLGIITLLLAFILFYFKNRIK